MQIKTFRLIRQERFRGKGRLGIPGVGVPPPQEQGRPLEFRLQAVCSLRAPSKPRDARPAKAGTPAVTRRSTKARAPTNRQSPYAGRTRADRRSRARKNRAIPAARAAPAGAATAGVDSTEDRAPAGDDEVGRLGFAQKRCLELCVLGSPDRNSQPVEFQTPFLGEARRFLLLAQETFHA